MTMRDQWLNYVADMNRKGFDVALSSRLFPKRVAEGLVSDGLLKRTDAVVCDGDGFSLEPERERVGYELTAAGRAAVDEMAAMEVPGG